MAAASAVPRDIAIGEGAMWMGPHGHVVHYPVRRGELINIVAHFDSDSWTEESWTRGCDVSELTTTYAGWHPDLLRLSLTARNGTNGHSTIVIRSSDGAKGG